MKTVLTKSLVVVVGGALVVPFAAAAVLVGARAVAGAGGTRRWTYPTGPLQLTRWRRYMPRLARSPCWVLMERRWSWPTRKA